MKCRWLKQDVEDMYLAGHMKTKATMALRPDDDHLRRDLQRSVVDLSLPRLCQIYVEDLMGTRGYCPDCCGASKVEAPFPERTNDVAKFGTRHHSPYSHWQPRLPLTADAPPVIALLGTGPSADVQVFGCHHPNIATKKHATRLIVRRPIWIQYGTGAASL